MWLEENYEINNWHMDKFWSKRYSNEQKAAAVGWSSSTILEKMNLWSTSQSSTATKPLYSFKNNPWLSEPVVCHIADTRSRWFSNNRNDLKMKTETYMIVYEQQISLKSKVSQNILGKNHQKTLISSHRFNRIYLSTQQYTFITNRIQFIEARSYFIRITKHKRSLIIFKSQIHMFDTDAQINETSILLYQIEM